jgi:hypothetical protein
MPKRRAPKHDAVSRQLSDIVSETFGALDVMIESIAEAIETLDGMIGGLWEHYHALEDLEQRLKDEEDA